MQELSNLKTRHEETKPEQLDDKMLNEVSRKMGCQDNQYIAYCVLKIILHSIRDNIPFQELFNFSDRLPLFMRGIFFEGYQPEDAPYIIYNKEFVNRYHKRMGPGNRERFEIFLSRNQPEKISGEEMLNRVRQNMKNEGFENSDDAIRAVLEVIRQHISEAEPEEFYNFHVLQQLNRSDSHIMKSRAAN